MIKTKTFGGYTSSTLEVLEEAVEFLKENAKINLADGILYSDEGHYFTLYWEEDEKELLLTELQKLRAEKP